MTMIHQPPPGFGRGLGRQCRSIQPRQQSPARPGDAGRWILRHWPTEEHHRGAVSVFILVAEEVGLRHGRWRIVPARCHLALVQQDQLRSVAASPAMMARAGGEGSLPSSVNPSRRCTAGWAIIRGPVHRCGQVAVWTKNGWHKKASPARPVACVTGRHRTDGRQNWPSALVPASPYGARN